MKIVNNALCLVQNPYGNYAIQKALEVRLFKKRIGKLKRLSL